MINTRTASKARKAAVAGAILAAAIAPMAAGTATAAMQDATPETSTSGGQNAAKTSHSAVGYSIKIHTADKNYAGTDGDVWMRVHGANGSARDWWYLDDSADNYERNRTDRFLRSGPNVGSLRCVTIAFNPLGGAHAEWLPDRIIVNDVVFQNTDWFLKGDKGDFQYRTLCK